MSNSLKSKYLSDVIRFCGLYAEAMMSDDENALNDIREEIFKLRSRMSAIAEESVLLGEFIPLEYLQRQFKLTYFEKYCLMLATVREVSPGQYSEYGRHVKLISGSGSIGVAGISKVSSDEGSSFTAGFAIASYLLVNKNEQDVEDRLSFLKYFSGSEPLFRYLLKNTASGDTRLMSCPLILRNRLCAFIFEEEYFSSELAGSASLTDLSAGTETKDELNLMIVDSSGEDADDQHADREIRTVSSSMISKYKYFEESVRAAGRAAVIILYGPDIGTKTAFIRNYCRKRDLALISVRNIADKNDSKDIINSIAFESVLLKCAVCFDVSNDENLKKYMINTPETIFLLAEKKPDNLSDILHIIGTDKYVSMSFLNPGERERLGIWQSAAAEYNIAGDINFRGLADRFSFSAVQIREIMKSAAKEAELSGSTAVSEGLIYKECYKKLSHHSSNTKIMKIPTVYEWNDLILPDYSKRLLDMACRQLDNYSNVYDSWGFSGKLPYGRGISMLFSGPPGTGKTMGAQVVARKMKLELYKVNLAAVVSKYIGETEKNLEEIFETAQRNQAVLFFDEADVLFSKRTEIKDSHDKYSNMEAAFMLQRIEEYDGVCILATNYMQNFDEAFKRRIRFIVEFPFPDASYRELLWKAVFPEQVPLSDDIDYSFLAKGFELSGSNIKNIALNAAFQASDEGRSVGMKEILRALQIECIKNGKHLSDKDFGEYYLLLE